MTTITSVGSVLAGLAFWLVLVPLMVVALWWLMVAVWSLALLALECVTNGIAAALIIRAIRSSSTWRRIPNLSPSSPRTH